MRDEHESAAVVVVLPVGVPRVLHIVVLQAVVERGAAAAGREQPPKPGERDLAVDRRIQTAFGPEPRELLFDDVQLRGRRLGRRRGSKRQNRGQCRGGNEIIQWVPPATLAMLEAAASAVNTIL